MTEYSKHDTNIEIDESEIPLCVDLDGTLIHGDTLLESCLRAVKAKPFLLFIFPFWILQGKLFFKEKVLLFAEPDYDTLLYRDQILEFIEQEKQKDRQIVLATASCQKIADKIAEDLGIFDLVLGSQNGINLRSEQKTAELQNRFKETGFDYMGDSQADIAVFKGARKGYLVSGKSKVRKKAKELGNVEEIFVEKTSTLKLIIKQMRIYQWVKNLLVFLPLLLAHKFPVGDFLVNSMTAFFSFSFIASAVYILNDLLDLSSDRTHPRKRKRPFASGKLSLKYGFVLIPLLLLAGFLPSILLLPLDFNLILLAYFILTTLYSFMLKRIYILDILILASLYTIRLLAGAVAVDVPASPWLLAFSMFIFLSLACVKRFTELYDLSQTSKDRATGRGYRIDDIGLVKIIGAASGLLSILVFVLYINSAEIVALYKTPILLYLVAFMLLYWILRIWFKAARGEMHDDPIVFTLRDKGGIAIILIIIGLVFGAAL